MKTIFDLPGELLEDEIFSRVPMTSLRSVRSTCRKWNSLCKNRILFGKAAAAKKQFMMMDSRICLMNLDLPKDDGDPSIKQVSLLDQIEISKVFQCNGLLLCVLKDCSRLLVWNPYLAQTRWIEPRISFQSSDRFAVGHDNNNLNHKILRISDEIHPVTSKHVLGFELYDFSSGSWKVLDVTPHWEIWSHLRGVSLKGNAYFPAQKKIIEAGTKIRRVAGFFLSFDFTTESFGPLLPLPFQSQHGGVFTSLSCVREDQLAVLYQHWEAQETVEISVTDKIGPNVVSWTKFLNFHIRLLELDVVTGFWVNPYSGSFFIDEEKKIAVVFVLETVKACRYQTAHVIGQNGYFKSVRIREAPYVQNSYPHNRSYLPLLCYSYLPSLVQL
ncbi:BnaAnng07440D [Brassica napus]|uniref:BnaAnng07440D protein n=1 Tax=Brassica napus TaxID=3708 RepID=A0A078I2A6_BRANA|nr:BnaAnng07440D [Brassica napus]